MVGVMNTYFLSDKWIVDNSDPFITKENFSSSMETSRPENVPLLKKKMNPRQIKGGYKIQKIEKK